MNDPRYGKSVDGLELSDELIARLFDDAEQGHDIERLKLRLRPGRPAPLPIGRPIDCDLSVDLIDLASTAADARGVSLNELIRQVVRQHLELAGK